VNRITANKLKMPRAPREISSWLGQLSAQKNMETVQEMRPELKGSITNSLIYRLTSVTRSQPEAEGQEAGCSFKIKRIEKEGMQAQNQTQAQIQGSPKMKRYSQIEMTSLGKTSTTKKKISRERLMKSSTA